MRSGSMLVQREGPDEQRDHHAGQRQEAGPPPAGAGAAPGSAGRAGGVADGAPEARVASGPWRSRETFWGV